MIVSGLPDGARLFGEDGALARQRLPGRAPPGGRQAGSRRRCASPPGGRGRRAWPRCRSTRGRRGRRSCRARARRHCAYRCATAPGLTESAAARRSVMCSPIVPTACLIASSTVVSTRASPPAPPRASRRSSSAASATLATSFWKSALRATKSVSELTSTITARPGARGDADQAFGGDAAGLLGRLGKTLGAQPVDRRLHVAAGLGQRRLAVHHPRAGLLAELLHHSCGYGHCHKTSPVRRRPMSAAPGRPNHPLQRGPLC